MKCCKIKASAIIKYCSMRETFIRERNLQIWSIIWCYYSLESTIWVHHLMWWSQSCKHTNAAITRRALPSLDLWPLTLDFLQCRAAPLSVDVLHLCLLCHAPIAKHTAEQRSAAQQSGAPVRSSRAEQQSGAAQRSTRAEHQSRAAQQRTRGFSPGSSRMTDERVLGG